LIIKENAMIADAFREQAAKAIRYVKPVRFDDATGLTAQVYRQMQEDFMVAPVLTLHSPEPEIMAGAWCVLRETLLAGKVDRTLKETVAATVSRLNACPFCVDAHTMMLHASAEHDVASAIRRGDFASIRDPQLHAIVRWALLNQTSGAHDGPPPCARDEVAEIIGTVIAFHYINRMANVFLGDALLPMPSALKGVTGRVIGTAAGKRFVRPLEPGAAVGFVPQVALPDDLAWAATRPTVSVAFAGFAGVVEQAGEKVLPEPVRALVCERVRAWNGESMGMSRRWVEDAVDAIEEEHRPAARLTLLTALASYQVDEGVVEAYRTRHPDDGSLVVATAWASLVAARRVGDWLTLP
jgi:AhpD family alkylhydroperoxidase